VKLQLYSFFNSRARRGWVGAWLRPSPGRLIPGNDPVPTVYEPPGPEWTDADNLAPTGIPSPDHTASSESLYLHTHLLSMTSPTDTNSVVVTRQTSRFQHKKIYVLHTERIYVFSVDFQKHTAIISSRQHRLVLITCVVFTAQYGLGL
jgi:hypothetical protein